MAKFTKQQPRDGETVMHCGHIENSPHHFFGLPEEIGFTRPDKSIGKSRWIVLCQPCFNLHAEHLETCIRGDAQWIGNEPAIKENFN